MGGHKSFTFPGNASQLSYRPFKFSGESDSIKALRKEALESPYHKGEGLKMEINGT